MAARSPALDRMGPEVARKVGAQLAGDDLRQGRLARPGGPESSTWSSGRGAGAGGVDEHAQVGLDRRLAVELGQGERRRARSPGSPSGETRRLTRSPRALLQRRFDQGRRSGGLAEAGGGGLHGAARQGLGQAQAHERGGRLARQG